MSRAYSREDVQTHSDGYGRGSRPAVNVKVYGSFRDRDVWAQFTKEELPTEDVGRFTLEWIEENVSEETLDQTFWDCCEAEFEYLEEWATGSQGPDAEDILFPDDRVELIQEGRSGGWIAVDGLPDIEDWDAVRLARWRRFERIAREIAAGIPYQMLSSLYINQYEWARQEREERERAANHDIATVAA